LKIGTNGLIGPSYFSSHVFLWFLSV
jgi:hypothetical protein